MASPSAEVVAAARDGEALDRWTGTDPLRWRYPNTAIDIVEITDGDRRGEFLFSAGTVRHISDYYELAAPFPYRLTQSGVLELQYRSPEISPGFYDRHVYSPGDLILRISTVGQIVHILPDWMNIQFGGQTLWQWAGLTLTIVVGLAAGFLIFASFRPLRDLHRIVRVWLSIAPPLLIGGPCRRTGPCHQRRTQYHRGRARLHIG